MDNRYMDSNCCPHPCPPPHPPKPPHPPYHCYQEKVIRNLQEDVIDNAADIESVRKFASKSYEKLSNIILDPSGSHGREQFRKMMEMTDKSTLIEAIVTICERMQSGEGVNITYETVVDALGYTPGPESGSNYTVGIFVDDEEEDNDTEGIIIDDDEDEEDNNNQEEQ